MLDQLTQEPVLAGIIAAIVVVVIVALIVWYVMRRRKSRRLERRFGTEYRRTVDASGSRREAEQGLEARRRKREEMDVKPLTSGAREDLRGRFEELQASFVDAPESALRSVHHLVAEVAALRGYQRSDGASRLDMVSVDHPEDVAVHQRHMSRLDGSDRIETEELRQGMLDARRLFERLVGEGEADDPAAPRPPRTLLGLDDDEDDDIAVADDDASTDDDVPGRGDTVGEATARTISTRPDDDQHVHDTVDLTEHERDRSHRG